MYSKLQQQKNQKWNRTRQQFNPFRTAVPIWGQTSLIPSDMSPKRDWGPKRVNILLFWVRNTPRIMRCQDPEGYHPGYRVSVGSSRLPSGILSGVPRRTQLPTRLHVIMDGSSYNLQKICKNGVRIDEMYRAGCYQ